MEETGILGLAYKLRRLIDESFIGQALLKSEADLTNDEKALTLQRQIEETSLRYHEALLAEDEDKISSVRHDLYLLKLAFDQLPSVLKYRKNYAKVRLIYEKINEEVFQPFQGAGIKCRIE